MKKKYTKEEWHILFLNDMFIYECPKVHVIYIGEDGCDVGEFRWKKAVHRALWHCTWKLFFLIPVPCYCYRLEGNYYVRDGFHLKGKCPWRQ